LFYVGSRYYDPETGRWLNSDSQLNASQGVLGTNLFAYCLNNRVPRKGTEIQPWQEWQH